MDVLNTQITTFLTYYYAITISEKHTRTFLLSQQIGFTLYNVMLLLGKVKTLISVDSNWKLFHTLLTLPRLFTRRGFL